MKLDQDSEIDFMEIRSLNQSEYYSECLGFRNLMKPSSISVTPVEEE